MTLRDIVRQVVSEVIDRKMRIDTLADTCTITEACHATGISRRSMERYIASGRLRTVELPSRMRARIVKRSLIELIEEQN